MTITMVKTESSNDEAAFKRGIAKANTFLRMFRTLAADMPMQQAEVLLQVASYPKGAPMSDLEKRIGISQASVSRNVAALSKFHRLGKPGLNLVEAVIDPREPRKRLVFLTQEGKVFITKLIRTIEADFSIDMTTDAQVEIDRAFEEAQRKAADEGKTRGKIGKLPPK